MRNQPARLIFLNGPPRIGKSALAKCYLDDHPLALKLDIDAVRCSLEHVTLADLVDGPMPPVVVDLTKSVESRQPR